MADELCSVIMPAYNAERYITDAIKSVINQTYEYIELIIVDDCSSDGTREIVERFAKDDNRIKPIFNNKNLGCAESRNKAIRVSRGDYIAFIDSDDIWVRNKLEIQLDEMKNRNCSLSYTAFQIIYSNGQYKNKCVKENVTFDLLLSENVICCSSVVLKGDVARNHYMISDYFHEDYCYWLSLLKEGYSFYGINEILVRYRLSPYNRSKNKLNAALYRWQIYRKYLNLPLGVSIRYIGLYMMNGIKKYYL